MKYEIYDGNAADTTTTKPSNPKDAAAFGKRIAWSVIPWRALVGACLALAEGAWKYGRHNYRAAGVRASVYFDAVNRHMLAWWEGQDTDPASRLNHIDKAIAGLLVLRDSMLAGNWEDDRPPRVDGDWIETANALYADLGVTMQAAHGLARAPFVHTTDVKIPAGAKAVLPPTVLDVADQHVFATPDGPTGPPSEDAKIICTRCRRSVNGTRGGLCAGCL